jgi:cobyrinic acid a,c-diamide synthase
VVTALPRLVVAAPGSAQGKTTVATGLMAALADAGHAVSGHKVGPDYIDPGYHALATGRPGRNLDPHLVGERRVVPLLLHGARGADLAVVEGAMGLHDGLVGGDGFASTAHVAALTRTPVVLVVDVSRMSRSAGAVVHGMAAYDPAVEVVAVVLNKAGSARAVAEVERATRLPVVGVLRRDGGLETPSRHLGLVPVAERAQAARMVERLGEEVARCVDLDAVLELARSAPGLTAQPWAPAAEVRAGASDRPVVAVAGGRAFTFRYAETDELLAAAGCEVVGFDPLTDRELPPGTRGVYLGGGFPEVYAAELAANRPLLAEIREAVTAGMPTVAECAGLLYLAESLDGASMAGALPLAARMTSRLTLRYATATATWASLLTRAGEQVTGHEFHRTQLVPAAASPAVAAAASRGVPPAASPAVSPAVSPAGSPAGSPAVSPAWLVDGQPDGVASATVHAAYLHVHWAGHPMLAQRFADAVHAAAPVVRQAPPVRSVRALSASPLASVPDPLRHHGDVEAGPGLLDFAVNVYAGPRPSWLDDALHESIDAAAGYPDAGPARRALARRHRRPAEEVLPTPGAAEAFTLLAGLRRWGRPVVVNPQFTEPQAALENAAHRVTSVVCRAGTGFALDPEEIPDDADLVVVGNPTNPTGALHPAGLLRGLLRPGRLVVVDEAFMDAVPGESESLAEERLPGLVVVRSLTKHWSMPGIRAGYVVGDPTVVARLADRQTPWSVSAPAVAAMLACSTQRAVAEGAVRAATLSRWRDALEAGLRERGVELVPSAAPFVLARLGEGAHAALRDQGVAVRRADTFPGLDGSWVRVAVRPPDRTALLLDAWDLVRDRNPHGRVVSTSAGVR